MKIGLALYQRCHRKFTKGAEPFSKENLNELVMDTSQIIELLEA